MANEIMVPTTNALMPPDDFDHLQRVARMLAVSRLFSAKGEDAQAVAETSVKIMAGLEMGIGPVASVQNIHVINGNPSVSAHMIATAIKEHPKYNYKIKKWTNDVCDIIFYEDGKEVGSFAYSFDDASRAGIAGKDVWKKYRRAMLFARAISAGYRGYCPDALGKSRVYAYEEMGATVDESGSIVIVDGEAMVDDVNKVYLTDDQQERVDKLRELDDNRGNLSRQRVRELEPKDGKKKPKKSKAKEEENPLGDETEEAIEGEVVDDDEEEEEEVEVIKQSPEVDFYGDAGEDEGDEEKEEEEEGEEEEGVDEDDAEDPDFGDDFSPFANSLMNPDYELGEEATKYVMKTSKEHKESGRRMNKSGYDKLCEALVEKGITSPELLTPYLEVLCQDELPEGIPGALIGKPVYGDMKKEDKLAIFMEISKMVDAIAKDMEG